MGVKEFFASLGDNQFFGAGAGLMVFGLGVQVLKRSAVYGNMYLRKKLLITLEVPNKDPCYPMLLNWISVRGMHSQHLSVNSRFQTTESGKVSMHYDFLPSPGTHFFKFKSKWIKVDRNREGSIADMNSGQPFESVQLQAFGYDRSIYFDILEDARQLAMQRIEGKTVVYKAFGGNWQQFGSPRQRRPLSSVILDKNVKETILKDIREFIESPEWYKERGVPYRRGYLLHGPPGCGKTSFITSLAGTTCKHNHDALL